jgi:hypothetical protein
MEDSKSNINMTEEEVRKEVNNFFDGLEKISKEKGEDIDEFREFIDLEPMFKYQLEDKKLNFTYNIKEINQNLIYSIIDKIEIEEEYDEFNYLINQISADTSGEINTNLVTDIEEYFKTKINKFNKLLDNDKSKKIISDGKKVNYFNHFLIMKQINNLIDNYMIVDYERYKEIVISTNNELYEYDKNQILLKTEKINEKIKGIKGKINEYLKEYVLTRQEKWFNNITGNIKIKKISKFFIKIRDKIYGEPSNIYKVAKRLKKFFGLIGLCLWFVDNSFGYRAVVKFFNIFDDEPIYWLGIMGGEANFYIRLITLFILILLITIVFKLFIGRIFDFSIYSKDIKIYEENAVKDKKDINYNIKEGLKNIFGFSYPMNIKYTKTNSIFLVISIALSVLIISAFITARIIDVYSENNFKLVNEISLQISSIFTDNLLSEKIKSLFLLLLNYILYINAVPTLLIGIGFLLPIGCSISFHIMFTFMTIESKEKKLIQKRNEYSNIISECKKTIKTQISSICYYIYGIVRIEDNIIVKLKETFTSCRNKFLKNTKDEVIWRIIQKTHSLSKN